MELSAYKESFTGPDKISFEKKIGKYTLLVTTHYDREHHSSIFEDEEMLAGAYIDWTEIFKNWSCEAHIERHRGLL